MARAKCHLTDRNFDKAQADLNEATRLDVNEIDAYAMRGEIWDERGDREKAPREYDEAIRVGPKSALAHMVRAAHHGEHRELRQGVG